MSQSFDASAVARIARLANIPLPEYQEEELAQAFTKTMEVVDQLNTIETSGVEPTHQVTGLTNVWRDDVVIPEHSFTQAEALSNAALSVEGYFAVPQVREEK